MIISYFPSIIRLNVALIQCIALGVLISILKKVVFDIFDC